MIEDPRGAVDYDEAGAGPTLVLVPGSCSTGAAWRPVIAVLGGGFRCVTTSLLGYGGTAERRTPADTSIAREADVLEAVVRRAGAPVHMAGHSFGGLCALALALRDPALLASLTIIEAPAPEFVRDEPEHHRGFRDMAGAYFAAYEGGDGQAVGAMIDFYGGAGTFAAWPPRVRAYAMETTPVNIRDWATAFAFRPTDAELAALDLPVLVVRGGDSNAAMQRANGLIAERVPGGALVTVAGAAHFMIATHAAEVAALVERHVRLAEAA